jgi:hypothetical protein
MFVILALTVLFARVSWGRSTYLTGGDKKSPYPPIEIILADPPPPVRKNIVATSIRLSNEVGNMLKKNQNNNNNTQGTDVAETMADIRKALFALQEQNKELRERVELLEDWIQVEQQLLDTEHEQRVKAHTKGQQKKMKRKILMM